MNNHRDLPDMALTRYTTPIAGTAPAGSVLVVELFTPDGRPDGHSFFIGSNAGGQSGPTLIAAADCNAPEPTDTTRLGYPNMHVVMNVSGNVTSALVGAPARVLQRFRRKSGCQRSLARAPAASAAQWQPLTWEWRIHRQITFNSHRRTA